MVAIANIMKKQQQQMNKITDILARISGFLEQGNLSQNTPSNGVPPSTSHQQPLGQNTPKRVPPIERNDEDQGQQTNQMGYNAPFGFPPNTSQKTMVLGQTTCTDTGKKGDESLFVTASNLFFQGNENEIQKDVYARIVKKDYNHSSALGSTHNGDQNYWPQSKEKYDYVVEVGTEVSSSMASATKIFWEKLLNEGKFNV